MRDEIISVEMEEDGSKGPKQLIGFYEVFKTYLINTLTGKQFADLYAQTITYGLFAARTRVPIAIGREFNRRMAFDYIPYTIGILRDVFRFISLEDLPRSLEIIIDDISEILKVVDVNNIFQEFQRMGKGRDPIIHFYETFLATYDPVIRERRGVIYTPEAVVGYIMRAIHTILKSHFGLADGLADDERFKLYLTNTFEIEEIEKVDIPRLSSLSEESHLAGKIKKEQPALVVAGNPPYSGISANINEWTGRLLKEDIDGCQSYYKVDDQPLGEKKV